MSTEPSPGKISPDGTLSPTHSTLNFTGLLSYLIFPSLVLAKVLWSEFFGPSRARRIPQCKWTSPGHLLDDLRTSLANRVVRFRNGIRFEVLIPLQLAPTSMVRWDISQHENQGIAST